MKCRILGLIILHMYQHLCCFDSTGKWGKFPDSFVWDQGWSQHPYLALSIGFLTILKWNIERNKSSEKMHSKILSETSVRVFGLLKLYFLYGLFHGDLFCYRKHLLTFYTNRHYPSSLNIKRDYFLGQRWKSENLFLNQTICI